MPALAGSLQVAVNTDMSIGLAILVGFLSVAVTVALWCGLLQRLMQAGGILQEAADAARSLPALVLLLPPLLMLGLGARTLTLTRTRTLTLTLSITLTLTRLGLLFCYYIYVALLLASAGHSTRGLMHFDRHLQLYVGLGVGVGVGLTLTLTLTLPATSSTTRWACCGRPRRCYTSASARPPASSSAGTSRRSSPPPSARVRRRWGALLARAR